MRKYTTIQGDMWDGIAKKVYGDEAGMNILIEANQKYVDTIVFGSNVVLDVPEYKKPTPAILPPWRR